MKTFLIKSLLFVIAIVIVFAILDKVALSGLSKLKDDDYKDLYLLYNNKIDDDILILGSSRAWNHFDVKEIEKISKLNARVIGLSGADFHMQRALWEQAFNNDSKTQYIVHVVGSLEFSKRTDGIFKKYKFYPYLDKQYVYSNLSNLQPDLWKDRYLPMYKFHGYYEYFLKGLGLYFSSSVEENYNKYKGFKGLNGTWNGKVNINQKNISETDIINGVNFIKEEAKLAEEKGKKLIIVYTPEHNLTNTIIKGKNKIIDTLNKVTQKYNNVYFLDYSKWIGNDSIELFSNATHLNSKGAKFFAATFANDLMKIVNNK